MHVVLRRILVVLLAACTTTALAPSASAGQQSGTYNMPSSIVVQGIFGFGVLLCADSTTPGSVDDIIQNGPCFDYDPTSESLALGKAEDTFWSDTSLTLAIDLNGDGCVSDSCQGVPNDEDVRESNCGTVLIFLPPTTNGAPPMIQSFLRAVDVDPSDLTVCGASSGTVNLFTS